MTKAIKKIVVVLSAGRSGTSLLMKILGELGMCLSENMIPGSVGNPEGFFEDVEIVEVHKDLLQDLNIHPALPMPDGWLESRSVASTLPKIRKILENRLRNFNGIWGFKDPRTVALLPLWNRILNAPGIVPVFLLAVRDPSATIFSLKRQINREEALAELQWLQRTTEALHHTAADCFIVHYEDWFIRSGELAEQLLEYTGLVEYFTGNVEETIKDIIKPNLNRSVYEGYQVQNEYVVKLYDVLKVCRGNKFDRERLMDIVKECRTAINGFKGWYMETHKYVAQQAQIREKMSEEQDRKLKLKVDLEKERESVQKKQAELDNVMKKLEQKKAEMVQVKKYSADLEQALSQDQAETGAQLQDLLKARNKIEEQKREVESGLHAAKKRIDEKSFELESSQKVNAELEQTLSLVQAEHEALEQELQIIKDKVVGRVEESDEFIKIIEQKLREAKDAAEERIKEVREEKEQMLQEKDERIAEKENDLYEITVQNNEYLRLLKNKHDELNDLRVRLSSTQKSLAQQAKNNGAGQKSPSVKKIMPEKQLISRNSPPIVDAQKLEREVLEMRNSYSFRIGQIIVNTVAKPGVNSIIFPFLLIRLIFEPFFKRNRKTGGN